MLHVYMYTESTHAYTPIHTHTHDTHTHTRTKCTQVNGVPIAGLAAAQVCSVCIRGVSQ